MSYKSTLCKSRSWCMLAVRERAMKSITNLCSWCSYRDFNRGILNYDLDSLLLLSHFHCRSKKFPDLYLRKFQPQESAVTWVMTIVYTVSIGLRSPLCSVRFLSSIFVSSTSQLIKLGCPAVTLYLHAICYRSSPSHCVHLFINNTARHNLEFPV